MSQREMRKDKDDGGRKRYSRSFYIAEKAEQAINYLIDHDGIVECTKEQFALKIGWVNPLTDRADVQLVKDVCTYTRDQADDAFAAEICGGMVIGYSDSRGCMTLSDPDGEMTLTQYMALFGGDLERQQVMRTVNRRRLPMWKTAGQNAANRGNTELARLCWAAEADIKGSGFVSEDTQVKIMRYLHTQGRMAS